MKVFDMNEEDKDKNKDKKGWKIDRNIPIAFILSIVITILFQIGMFLWSFATLTNELKTLSIQVYDLKTDIYRIDDAERDKELYNHKFDSLNKRVDKLETK